MIGSYLFSTTDEIPLLVPIECLYAMESAESCNTSSPQTPISFDRRTRQSLLFDPVVALYVKVLARSSKASRVDSVPALPQVPA